MKGAIPAAGETSAFLPENSDLCRRRSRPGFRPGNLGTKDPGDGTKSGRRERGTALFCFPGKKADPSADLEWAAALRGKATPVSPLGGLGTKRFDQENG